MLKNLYKTIVKEYDIVRRLREYKSEVKLEDRERYIGRSYGRLMLLLIEMIAQEMVPVLSSCDLPGDPVCLSVGGMSDQIKDRFRKAFDQYFSVTSLDGEIQDAQAEGWAEACYVEIYRHMWLNIIRVKLTLSMNGELHQIQKMFRIKKDCDMYIAIRSG